MASGSYQRPVGRSADINISQSMVSISLEEVTQALNHPGIMRRYCCFPGTPEEREATIARKARLGMPRTLGYIDRTLIRIVPPNKAEHPQVYRSRKGFTALNVQIVCNADLYIMNVNARFHGSSNDPYIYRSSPVRNVMMTAFNESRCWLLGDSIYPLEPWLMIPLNHAERGTPEYAYTKLHCHCRNAVERCIGLLKARWRCLLTDRTLHYAPVKAGCIVNGCVVLHNYLIEQRAPEPNPIVEDNGQGDPEGDLDEEDLQLFQQADQVRRYLINYAHAQRLLLHLGD